MDTINFVQNVISNLTTLQRKFMDLFPDDVMPPVIMPAGGPDGKIPKYAHAHKPFGVEEAIAHIPECAANGALVLLTPSVIVVDCDDVFTAEALMASIPVFNETVTTKTSKGYHFWFRSTPLSKEVGVVDGARQLFHSNGERMPIDIKTLCKSGTRGVISIPPSSGKEWIRSPLTYDILPIPDDFINFYEHFKKNPGSNKNNDMASPAHVNKIASQIRKAVDFQEVAALVDALPQDYKDNYDNWLRVLFCLKSIENSGRSFQLLIDFSKDSKHWIELESERYIKQKWESATMESVNRITIASLHFWVKTANPRKYHEIIGRRIVHEIPYLTATHNDIARIVSKLLKSQFVCASVRSSTWYKYEAPVWKEDVKQVLLRHEISTTVVKAIEEAFAQYAKQQKNKNNSFATPTGLMFVPDDDIGTSVSVTTSDAGFSDFSKSRSKTKSTGGSDFDAIPDLDELFVLVANIKCKLKTKRFKDEVVVECQEYMSDENFESKLNAQPHLIGFTNGVFDLSKMEFREALPSDYISKTVGYDYTTEDVDPVLADAVDTYFKQLFPDKDVREYTLTMFACQLYGGPGNNLVHLHAGFLGSASNGKSTLFNILDYTLGDYIKKFNISLITTKTREDAARPQPHFAEFEGVRIVYGTEPNQDDVLHSGILKEMSGGELIKYRTLFSNEMRNLRPLFKIHIMCNKTPALDGSDEGIKRRMRKIDYISKFVEAQRADPKQHLFPIDANLLSRVMDNDSLKLAYMKHILKHYIQKWDYTMPETIRKESECYLNENNPVASFIAECVVRDPEGFFTLADVRQRFTSFNNNLPVKSLSCFKKELEKCLEFPCLPHKKLTGKCYRNVFLGWRFIDDEDDDDNNQFNTF